VIDKVLLSQQHENDGSVEQRQAQIFQSQLSPAELAYQESLIQEREAEIREIETGIHELHEIFRDLGSLVGEQGEMLGTFDLSFFFPLS
jgi:syntaxin 7